MLYNNIHFKVVGFVFPEWGWGVGVGAGNLYSVTQKYVSVHARSFKFIRKHEL